jgi:hypothetical protein
MLAHSQASELGFGLYHPREEPVTEITASARAIGAATHQAILREVGAICVAQPEAFCHRGFELTHRLEQPGPALGSATWQSSSWPRDYILDVPSGPAEEPGRTGR